MVIVVSFGGCSLVRRLVVLSRKHIIAYIDRVVLTRERCQFEYSASLSISNFFSYTRWLSALSVISVIVHYCHAVAVIVAADVAVDRSSSVHNVHLYIFKTLKKTIRQESEKCFLLNC